MHRLPQRPGSRSQTTLGSVRLAKLHQSPRHRLKPQFHTRLRGRAARRACLRTFVGWCAVPACKQPGGRTL